MTINCSFKLAYTTNTFTKNICGDVTLNKLKEIIKNDVERVMGLTNFNIILAGTKYAEKNNPLDCTNDIITINFISRNNNKTCSFYIKPAEENINEVEENINEVEENINEVEENINEVEEIIQNNDSCQICYDNLIPIETITLGCNHKICRNCISSWYRTGILSCPFCRA